VNPLWYCHRAPSWTTARCPSPWRQRRTKLQPQPLPATQHTRGGPYRTRVARAYTPYWATRVTYRFSRHSPHFGPRISPIPPSAWALPLPDCCGTFSLHHRLPASRLPAANVRICRWMPIALLYRLRTVSTCLLARATARRHPRSTANSGEGRFAEPLGVVGALRTAHSQHAAFCRHVLARRLPP